ncbi:MAG: hypothetical protein KJ634_09515 [Gammaproteobacteria bacterium]|nr:hypothetical protein [Gammaproteobacteria bacterium]MBU1415846.1 hypothetical protein [Gammaproteobacteria bacterium]
MRRRLSTRRAHRGFLLVGLLVLLVTGVLIFAVTVFGPEAAEARRKQQTEAALAQAREALLGYATTFRDSIDPSTVYGYLPLPDLGYSATPANNRNNNVGCQHEGCDAGQSVVPAGSVFANYTVIGRFPWYLMGTEPIRDGYGECLWYAVSGSHKRTQPVSPMNWDTLGQIDVVVANGSANLASTLTSVHDRPVAVIFSAGPPLPGQDRAPAANQVVDQCGGNYEVANYLDPGTAGALAGVTNYFGGSTNNASGYTRDETRTSPIGPDDNTKSVATQGETYRRADNTLWSGACPIGSNCALVANDRGLRLTTEALFGAIRKSSGFRTDINSMLDRMVGCLRDSFAAGVPFVPQAIAGYASPADKSAGRIPDNGCYGDAVAPLHYFANWQDMFFVAQPTAGTFNVTVDGLAQVCSGVLIFAGQRGAGQSRADDAEQNTVGNYLENDNMGDGATTTTDDNLTSFVNPGLTFAGPGQLEIASPTQPLQQDIVRCIPTTGSVEATSPQNLVDAYGNLRSPLATYDPGTRTLTLGSEGATIYNGISANSLYGCAWTPEVSTRGNGFRAYFAFQFMGIDGLGNNGFVFAAVDGERNGTNVCGAAGSHLGYSGNNGVTPPLTFPKIGIEFDRQRNSGFSESADITVSNPGRNDPTGGEYDYHSAIVYWGHEQANVTDSVTRPQDDDNVHGFPTTGSQGSSPRPAPQNPGASSPGLAFKDYRAKSDFDGDSQSDSWLYHVRVEVTPTRNINASTAELSNTTFITHAWIERDTPTSANIIAAMQNTTRAMSQLYPSAAPTLSDTATVYDVAGSACGTGCPANQTCGTDNVCYSPALRSVRLGFTGSQRTQDQRVLISNFFASWLQ